MDPLTSPVVKEIFERYKGIYVYADIKIPDNENYRKMLVRSFVDRIYLYDDHFRILFNNGGKRGKSSKREAAEVERYFDSMSSETTLYAPPKSQGGAHLCEAMMGRT